MDELRPDGAVFAVGTSFANYLAEKLTKHCFKEIPKTNHKMLIEWTSIGCEELEVQVPRKAG